MTLHDVENVSGKAGTVYYWLCLKAFPELCLWKTSTLQMRWKLLKKAKKKTVKRAEQTTWNDKIMKATDLVSWNMWCLAGVTRGVFYSKNKSETCLRCYSDPNTKALYAHDNNGSYLWVPKSKWMPFAFAKHLILKMHVCINRIQTKIKYSVH